MKIPNPFSKGILRNWAEVCCVPLPSSLFNLQQEIDLSDAFSPRSSLKQKEEFKELKLKISPFEIEKFEENSDSNTAPKILIDPDNNQAQAAKKCEIASLQSQIDIKSEDGNAYKDKSQSLQKQQKQSNNKKNSSQKHTKTSNQQISARN